MKNVVSNRSLIIYIFYLKKPRLARLWRTRPQHGATARKTRPRGESSRSVTPNAFAASLFADLVRCVQHIPAPVSERAAVPAKGRAKMEAVEEAPRPRRAVGLPGGLGHASPSPCVALCGATGRPLLSAEEVVGAGMFVGTVLILLGATRTVALAAKVTPTAVIKGIQLGTGLQLITGAAAKLQLGWGGTGWRWDDNYELALAAFVFAFAFYRAPRMPVALILFVLGLAFALVTTYTRDAPGKQVPAVGFHGWPLVVPTWKQFLSGASKAGLVKITVGLLFGRTLLLLLDSLPRSILAVMLFVSGVELAAAFRGVEKSHEADRERRAAAGRWLPGGWWMRPRRAALGVGVRPGAAAHASVGHATDPTPAVASFSSSPAVPAVGDRRPDTVENSTAGESNDSVVVGIVTAAGVLAFGNAGVGFALGVAAHLLLMAGYRISPQP
ncbi:MAG: hypothetical protein BJ554DRAFT_1994 [Olpidium bornovanus]|uniref:Uncharacterized protein n=1 Tax=Olpidium bornovanus TaxID=278681 RepID=A0A8H8A141_9FUNG|nr:MAG: hypothetical protein BJ554DRAFT_1994 [Olpidium bornovanus]